MDAVTFLVLLGVLAIPVEGPTFDLVSGMAETMCQKAAASLKDMRWDRGGTRPEYVTSRLGRCAGLLSLAHREGFDREALARVVAIAYAETNFRPGAVGSVGERGMLQVRPEKHCHLAMLPETKRCHYELAGLRYLKSLVQGERRRRGPFQWIRVLRRYNGSPAYARKVERYAQAVLRRWAM